MDNVELKRLNNLYAEGEYQSAFELADKLSSKGIPDAKWILGNFYHLGILVDKDIDKSLLLYEEASKLGSYKAMFSLAGLYEPTIERSINLPEPNEEYSINLYNKANELCLESTRQKDAEAMYYLGLIYDSGCGVKPDHKIAFEWYKNAYENGYQFALNKVYEFCSNVHSPFYDSEKAKTYLEKLNESGMKII